MRDSFEYVCVKQSLDSISVEDTGNVILEANNDNGYYWFLETTTMMGKTIITQFGPLRNGESLERDNGYGFTYNQLQIDYSEKKLHKIIDKFLNDEQTENTSNRNRRRRFFN